MKALFIYAEKNSFANKETGEVIDYCKMSFLTKAEQKDNITGYEVCNVTTKASNYDRIKNFVSVKNEVEIEEEYIRAKDGLFKRKISKINDVEL